MEKLIAYCGGSCTECPAYIATMNDDQALRVKTAAEWTVKYKVEFTPDMLHCTSCKGDGVKVGYCSQCEIRKCATAKGAANCGVCEEFKTCETINGLIAAFPEMSRYFSDDESNQQPATN